MSYRPNGKRITIERDEFAGGVLLLTYRIQAPDGSVMECRRAISEHAATKCGSLRLVRHELNKARVMVREALHTMRQA